MSKYTFKANLDQTKAQDNFGTKNFSIVSHDDETLFNFQKDIDSSLKNYYVTRSGKKQGNLYNSRQEEIGSYEITSSEY